MPEAVVVSRSPLGALVAAALRAAGSSVTRVVPAGAEDPCPDVPVGTGLYTVDPGSAFARAVVGPLAPVSPSRGLWARGRVQRLPLDGADLPRLFPGVRVGGVVGGWVRARVSENLAGLVGGGHEERSYRDWVTRRFGAPAYDALYRPYAEKRFGDPDATICGVARVHHGGEAPLRVAPVDGPVATAARLAEGVRVVRAELRAVDAGGVDTDAGRIDGTPWLDLPPAEILPLAAGLDAATLGHHVSMFAWRDGVEVVVDAEAAWPLEVHVADADVPFFRVVRPGQLPGGGGVARLVAQYAVDRAGADDAAYVREVVAALARVGVTADAASARVRRLPHQHPLWPTRHLVRVRQWLYACEEAGLVPFGTAGLACPMDPGTALRWVEGRLGEEPVELRELGRQFLEPPPLDPPARGHLTDFVSG